MAKVKITGHASGSGVFTITAPNSNTDRTITLPDASVTLGTDATKLPLAGGTMTGAIVLGTNTVGGLQITTTATSNIGLGANAVDSITTGDYNVGLGDNALTVNSTGDTNVAVGSYALTTNSTGANNVAIGGWALSGNTTAAANTSVGYNSMAANTTGSENTALGSNAMKTNITGNQNSSVGVSALQNNTTGSANVAMGYFSLLSNTTGVNNTSIGRGAMSTITTGVNNTAVGHGALSGITADGNTAVGLAAGSGITSGLYNTAIGLVAGTVSNLTGNFNTSIGYNANPYAAGSSGNFTLGDGNVSALRCNASLSGLSDQRDKTDIVDLAYGLNFINQTRPVTFKWETRDGNIKDGKTHNGFLAQELLELGNNDQHNLVVKENPDKLEASYGNLLPMMVKAIQELSTKNNALEARIIALEA